MAKTTTKPGRLAPPLGPEAIGSSNQRLRSTSRAGSMQSRFPLRSHRSGGSRGGPSHEGDVMDPYALVLDAGSSSLKFCVFQRPQGAPWRVEARGQIEGIGTSPRLPAKDARGEKTLDDRSDP